MTQRKRNGTKDAGRYRIQASTEAEVARSRLARAYQAADQGHTERAVDLAVESAFDAGIATTYSLLGGVSGFQQETQQILNEAQNFLQEVSPMKGKVSKNPIENPKNAKGALTLAKKESNLLQKIFYAGSAYGHAQAKKDDTLSRQAIQCFDESFRSRERAMNPNPVAMARDTSTNTLKKKLLR